MRRRAPSEPLQWKQETLCGSLGGEAGQERESEPWGGVHSTSPRGSAASATSHAFPLLIQMSLL
jgi:hypothetical protein